MGIVNRQWKNLIYSFVTLVGFAFIGLAFNNCGGVGMMQASSTSVAQMSYDSKVNALKQIHSESLPANYCHDANNYSCLAKVFSTTLAVDSSENLGAQCVLTADHQELCVDVKKYSYTTSSAQQNCQGNCDDNFNFEEVECHLKLSLNTDGIYPLVATEPNVSASLAKVYQSCLSIQKGP